MPTKKILNTVSIPLEKDLREKIHNALQGNVVDQLLKMSNTNDTPNYVKSCYEGSAFKVEKTLMKKYFDICEDVKKALEFKEEVDFYIVSDASVNAGAYLRPSDDQPHTIIIHSGLIQLMNDNELKFVIGHEIGHLIERHSELGKLINFVYPGAKPVSLTYKISLWNQLAELESDRYGFLACRDLSVGVSALFKITTGLDLDKFDMNIAALLEHNDRSLDYLLGDKAVMLGETHPVNPIRIKAMQMFAEKYTGETEAGEYEKVMDGLFVAMSKIPSNPLDRHIARFIAVGGLIMASADNVMEKEEYEKILSELSEFLFSPKEFLEEIGKEEDLFESLQNTIIDILEINPSGRDGLLAYLIEVAIADSKIDQIEVDLIMELGEKMLGYTKKEIAQIFACQIQSKFQADILSII
ncbi:MAG: M48 family metallopeptidase [Paludibacteraceae bacterium]|nr:M48 family metallopeptidase [Paludibacteraceae bacterium]